MVSRKKCISQNTDVVSKINFLVFGVILSMLGIQGLLECYNEKISSIEHIKTYSFIFLVFGILFIGLAFLRCFYKPMGYNRHLESIVDLYEDDNDIDNEDDEEYYDDETF